MLKHLPDPAELEGLSKLRARVQLFWLSALCELSDLSGLRQLETSAFIQVISMAPVSCVSLWTYLNDVSDPNDRGDLRHLGDPCHLRDPVI